MGKTPIGGIGGVLAQITTEELSPARTGESTDMARAKKRTGKTRARVGRPPGKGTAKAPRREKLTVRIDAELAARYRDWSWDARCNLGELVERAMRDFYGGNHANTKPRKK